MMHRPSRLQGLFPEMVAWIFKKSMYTELLWYSSGKLYGGYDNAILEDTISILEEVLPEWPKIKLDRLMDLV